MFAASQALPASQNLRKSRWLHQAPGIGSNTPSPIAVSADPTRARTSTGSPMNFSTEAPCRSRAVRISEKYRDMARPDAVIGVDIDYESVGSQMLMVSASGTAVTLG